ncbi:hypothetical protein [Bradyrhizobium sp. ARR65]|uniref:hypothetical protein n=1 Tax=Bradyrhizobium sp. ARR65 TaxID=1040989 RepID=UPI0012FA7ABF|nr:hypothetical protein [Bradyrhizobium sp. ARR65]
MAIDITKALSKSANASTFGTAFVDGYLSPAFGARSKSEIDLLVFSCLIAAGAIDPALPTYEIARALNITQSRVRSLVLNWQLRNTARDSDLRPAVVAALRKTRFSSDGTLLSFGSRVRSWRTLLHVCEKRGSSRTRLFQKRLCVCRSMPSSSFSMKS